MLLSYYVTRPTCFMISISIPMTNVNERIVHKGMCPKGDEDTGTALQIMSASVLFI